MAQTKKAAAEGEEQEGQATNETVPGGVYIVGGVKVNCDGKPIEEAEPEPETPPAQ
jgi:invasion protein IalB